VTTLVEEDALWRRAEALSAGNVYQTNFYRFLTECCWTVDEAAGGEFALFPNDEYVRELCDILMVEPLTLLEKTRRVRATWLCSALEVWVCAGGRDPRWPALCKGEGFRQCIVISKKEEDANYVIAKRVKIIYDQLWKRGIAEKWPGFPTCRFSYTEANWSNGSQIKALPQGPDQVRQFGATLLRYEEFAHSPDAADTVGAALPLLQGKDGSGGHFIGVCTPNADSHARDIRDDEVNPVFGGPAVKAVDWPALRTEQDPSYRKYIDLTMKHLRAPEPGRMLPYWYTRAGWCVVQVPWLAVPGYSLKNAMKGQVKEQDKRREYTLDWDAATGKLIFPEFTPHVHVADHVLPFYPDLPLQVGWDMPGHPACVISQMNPYGQWCILSSVSPEEEESIGVYEFAQRVANHLLKCYAAPNGLALDELQLHHYGDPTGWKLIPRPGEAPQEARSCYDILDRGVRMVTGHNAAGEAEYEERPGWGWRVQPGEVGVTARWEALRAWLDRMTRGEPAFIVCQSAKMVTKAVSSYQYKELAEGRYSNEALKNWASHTSDALCYIATRLNTTAPKKERRRSAQPVTSHAATQSRGRG
jgi:hypothetical protein